MHLGVFWTRIGCRIDGACRLHHIHRKIQKEKSDHEQVKLLPDVFEVLADSMERALHLAAEPNRPALARTHPPPSRTLVPRVLALEGLLLQPTEGLHQE